MANSQPTSGVAAVFHEVGRPLELQNIPLPRLRDGEALVRVQLCSICGSDLHTITGKRIEPTPIVLGHEVVGQIVATANEGPRDIDGNLLRNGDRVTWSICVSCQDCSTCNAGWPQKCQSLYKYGHSRAEGRGALSGGFSEYILLRPKTAVIRIDDEFSDHLASPMSCATATAMAACRMSGTVAKQRVLIVGAGLLGLNVAAHCKSQGAESVTVCDLDSERLEWAKRFGADEVCQDLSQLSSRPNFDTLFECSGAVSSVESACGGIVGIGGRVILVGSVMPSRPAQWDPEQIVRRCLTVRGIHNYAPDDLRSAAAFLKSTQALFPFDELIETTFELSDINDAIRYAIERRPIRVALRPTIESA